MPYTTESKVNFTLRRSSRHSDHLPKEKKMNTKKIINPLALGVGIGAAMSVALKDAAVGWAIGIAIGFTFYMIQRNNSSASK